jgi:hypothetical protein
VSDIGEFLPLEVFDDFLPTGFFIFEGLDHFVLEHGEVGRFVEIVFVD